MSTLGDICAVACAELFRADGGHDKAIMVSPMAPIPKLGAKLAKATFSPDIVLTDGVATIVNLDGEPIGAMPFTRVFDTLWNGRRHVMMGATQVDRHGRQNISCLGDHARPKVQLLGSRGAPGNTICHPTSYWIGRHSARVLVDRVDFVSGLGTTDGAFEIRGVVSNLGVFDLKGPGGTMRLVSLHPGVTVDDVQDHTGFTVHVEGDVPTTRAPSPEELALLDHFDPGGTIRSGVKGLS